MVLYEDLGVTSIEELRDSIQAGKLEGHRSFAARTAENILHGIDLLERSHGRTLLSTAMEVAEEIVSALSSVKGCARCADAGSLRRMRETVGDVDILAAAKQPGPVMASDELILRAKRYGVVFAMNTDAHSTVHLNYLRYGVGTAQRGWITAGIAIRYADSCGPGISRLEPDHSTLDVAASRPSSAGRAVAPVRDPQPCDAAPA